MSTAINKRHGGPADERARRRTFVFEFEETTYQHDRSTITGAEIMRQVGIEPSVGLVQYFEDGSQQTIKVEDVVKLVSKTQFRKRPRFKRG